MLGAGLAWTVVHASSALSGAVSSRIELNRENELAGSPSALPGHGSHGINPSPTKAQESDHRQWSSYMVAGVLEGSGWLSFSLHAHSGRGRSPPLRNVVCPCYLASCATDLADIMSASH